MHLEWLSLLLPQSSSREYPYFLQTIDHHLTTFYWTFTVSQYVHTQVYCCESRLTRLCRTACDEAEAVKDRCREGKSVAGSRRVFAEEKSVTQRRQVSRVNAGYNSSEKQAVSHPRPRSRGSTLKSPTLSLRQGWEGGRLCPSGYQRNMSCSAENSVQYPYTNISRPTASPIHCYDAIRPQIDVNLLL